MMHYRKAFEMWKSYGYEEMRRCGRKAYRRFHGNDDSSDYHEVIAGVP
jgi:hypothetical protein